MLRNSEHKLRAEYASTKQARNEKVYRYFVQLLREEGEKSPYLPRSYFYEKIALVFDIAPQNIGRIITGITNSGTYKNFLTVEECQEFLDARVKVSKRE